MQVVLKPAPGQVGIIAGVSLSQRINTANSDLQSLWKAPSHWQSKMVQKPSIGVVIHTCWGIAIKCADRYNRHLQKCLRTQLQITI